MDTVIETRGLTKRYGGDVCALYDADVSVRRGDIFGVVGDNGAGKTTLFKLLCGLAFPTEGEVRLFGAHEPRELERQRTRIGSIIESPGFYPGLSVEKNLECCRIRKGVPGKDAVARVLDTVGLAYAKDAHTHARRARNGILIGFLHRVLSLIRLNHQRPGARIRPLCMLGVRTYLASGLLIVAFDLTAIIPK